MFRVALVGGLLAGCSFVAVTPVPSRTVPSSEPLACTDTYGWPVADTIGAIGVGALVGFTAYALSGLQHDCGSGNCKTESERARGGLVAGVVVSLPWTISAIYGYVKTSQCAGAKRRRRD
jgi:hypothetical protein